MRILLIISISIIMIAALLWTKPDTYAELQSLSPSMVKVDVVKQIDIQPFVKATGKLEPARKASLHFQVSGQINERFVEPGTKVKAKDQMLSVDSGDFVDAVEESKALLEIKRDTIKRDLRLLELIKQERELQEEEVKRLKQLDRNSLTSKSNYDQALQSLYRQQAEETRLNHSVNLARSELKVEKARLSKARRNLERTQLISPFDGIINTVYVEVGDYVSPGQTALEIIQLDELDLNLEISGTAASKLELGQKIEIQTEKDNREGEVIAIALDPNSETNTHTLKIRLASNGLFSGQLAVANLPGQYYEKANVIPISSILYEDNLSYIFEVIDNHVIKKEIRLIERFNNSQIIEGVESGIRIVSKDVSSLTDGQVIIAN
ncbi:MAG: efflux RND transporter periplasmic adaptor subunit [Pseudomonadota bacterium]|nr:efflux RND transporter periplasmic adaptor subunit [Pseudomonadota bacterium]